jgi:hypothetical protein
LSEGGSKDPNNSQLDQLVLQMGQQYVVPLTGGYFKSETAVIALDSNGLPTSIQVVEKAAAGAVLSGAAKDTATQLAALPGQIRAAQLAQTKDQTSQLTAQAALDLAQANAGVSGQTGQLAAQTALINAQIALANAQTNAGIPLQTAGVAAQTALLNAQAAQINAAAALAKAKATVP